MASLKLDILISSLSELASNHNLSVNKMLIECGASKSVVDNLKRGRCPNIDIIYTIAEYFDVSIDSLLGREKSSAIKLPLLSENQQDMLTQFNQLTEREQLKEIVRLELFNQQEADQTKQIVV